MVHLSGIFSRFIVGFAWILVIGFIANDLALNSGLAALFVALTTFCIIHIKLDKPSGWSCDRLVLVIPRFPLLLLITSIIVVLGDVFWLYHVKTSQDDFSDDPLLLLIAIVIALPLIEEFGFRLWLQSYLERFINGLLAIFIISLLFALIHEPDMPIPQLLSGCLYGITLLITKSIWVPVVLHVLHNLMLVVAGEIEVIRAFSFAQMDRTDNLNLWLAVTLWIISISLMLLWWRRNIVTEKT